MNRAQQTASPPTRPRGPDALARELVRLDTLLALATPEEAYHAQQHELDQPGGSTFAVAAVELLAVVWEGLSALETLRGDQRERERLRLITFTGLVYGLRLLGSLIEHDGPDTVLDTENGDSTAEAVIHLVQRLRATVSWLRETQFELRVAMLALDALFQDLDAAPLTVPVMMDEVSSMWVALEVLGSPRCISSRKTLYRSRIFSPIPYF